MRREQPVTLDMVMLRPTPGEAPDDPYPTYLDQEGEQWAPNMVITDEAENDACGRCSRNIKDTAYSVFLVGTSELRCSECVQFVEGARPPSALEYYDVTY